MRNLPFIRPLLRPALFAFLLAVLGTAVPRTSPAAPAPLPAALVEVTPYTLPPSGTAFPGASILDSDTAAAPAPSVHFDVRWWANPAPVDKTGLVLVLSFTRDASPSVVRNLSRPLPPTAGGNQTANLDLPDPAAGRVLSWRAAILQRGRVVSILQSPDWNSAP